MSTYAYVPVVKGKVNDLKAVSRVSPVSHALIQPMIEVLPVLPDLTVDQHLEKFTHNLAKHLSGRNLFVDFYGLLPGQKLKGGTDATIGGFRLLRGKGLKIVPTYGFDRDDGLWTPLRAEVDKHGKGFCFRVDIDDLDDRSEETWGAIIERSAELGLSSKEIDIFIDLRYVGDSDVGRLKELVLDFLSFAPPNAAYRSVIVSGSSALKHVGSIPKDGVADVERRELHLWMQLQVDLFEAQKLKYSDYGVVHPDFSIVGPNKNSNAKIRHTTSGKFRIFRGHKLSDAPGFKQFHALANEVRNDSSYQGPAFSDGDKYIDNCADAIVGSGNLGTWVFVDMNHHVEHVAQQVQALTEKIDEDFSSDEINEVMELV